MGKKSKPPPAPDYKAAAEATAKSNQAAQQQTDWANRPDQTDMYGNRTTWTNTVDQDAYNRALAEWQQYGQGQVVKGGKDIAAQPRPTAAQFTRWSQQTTLSPQQQAILNQQQNLQQGLMGAAGGMLGRAQEAVAQPFDWSNLQAMGTAPQAGNLQAGNLDADRYATTGAGQGMMAGLNTGSLGAMPQADDAGRQRIENALFARMAPQHQQAQAGLEAKLANMGLTRGSAAWNREAQRLGDQQARERFNALEIGGQEQQRQFGMGMQGRQQGWQELLGAGQFQNQAQQQAMQQMLAQNAQNFGQQAQAGQQNFGQQQQALNQNFNQQMAQSNYQNQLRQQQIAEQQMARQMPLNELNAFMSGQQVSNPNFAQFNTSQYRGGVDYSGAAQNQYNAAMNNYNAGQQGKQGVMGNLTNLAGAGMMAFSDRRLKSNIVRVGEHPIGVGIYEYDIGGRRERGVMAQELQAVAPHLVYTHSSGYLMVDYGGL